MAQVPPTHLDTSTGTVSKSFPVLRLSTVVVSSAVRVTARSGTRRASVTVGLLSIDRE